MITSCQDYHRHTSYDRDRMEGHFLDWSNQPSVYKEYHNLKVVPLPVATPIPEASLSEIALSSPVEKLPASFSLEQLSHLFSLAYRLTAKSRHAKGELFYRSVPSAGALYPCELYVATRSLPGLPGGLYHYAIGRRGLVQLRSGNYLGDPSCPSLSGTGKEAPLLMFFVTAIFFRSAWKYRARSYRYHLMDSGHLLESLTLALKTLYLPCEVILDFEDQGINSFLGCDAKREVCLAIVSVGCRGASDGFTPRASADLPQSASAASQVSRKEIVYPALQQIHLASTSLVTPTGAIPAMIGEVGEVPTSWKAIPESGVWPEQMHYHEVVGRRRSHRNFIKAGISQPVFEAFITLLCAGNEVPDSRSQHQRQSIVEGFLAGNVEGFDPGCYWLDESQHRVGMIRSGGLLARMAHICLDQEWLTQASLHFFFATNLELLDKVWGPRGYRYAMMTAGRLGQRIYLAATAFGLGCCGIGAFYDREAAALLGLNEASAMLYLLAVGPVRRAGSKE
jgi:SagB-type dehydrogenase family enzyme